MIAALYGSGEIPSKRGARCAPGLVELADDTRSALRFERRVRRPFCDGPSAAAAEPQSVRLHREVLLQGDAPGACLASVSSAERWPSSRRAAAHASSRVNTTLLLPASESLRQALLP